MKPSQVAHKLRQIATAIDNSRSPRRDLVAADLKQIIGSMQFEAGIMDWFKSDEEFKKDWDKKFWSERDQDFVNNELNRIIVGQGYKLDASISNNNESDLEKLATEMGNELGEYLITDPGFNLSENDKRRREAMKYIGKLIRNAEDGKGIFHDILQKILSKKTQAALSDELRRKFWDKLSFGMAEKGLY
jgi:hypothetical protein